MWCKSDQRETLWQKCLCFFWISTGHILYRRNFFPCCLFSNAWTISLMWAHSSQMEIYMLYHQIISHDRKQQQFPNTFLLKTCLPCTIKNRQYMYTLATQKRYKKRTFWLVLIKMKVVDKHIQPFKWHSWGQTGQGKIGQELGLQNVHNFKPGLVKIQTGGLQRQNIAWNN